ncbi:sulfide/dihydroorotate dehydrogenase-like FAD/NAD-binding protein [Candidatus Margulisiibacteriota bacterium]
MKITHQEVLADTQGTRLFKIVVQAPHIAQKAQPGQFVVAMVSEKGERIPLTVVETTNDEVTLIVQELGLSTKLLGKLKAGDSLYALTGPLGHATEIKNYGKVVMVAGGVGIAEIYPVAKKLKEAGNYCVIIIGARTKELLFLEKELQAVADEFYVTTDDGSYQRKGYTTDVLKEALEQHKFALAYIVGPIPMMKIASKVTEPFGVKTYVSLNALMLDGTGMCGGCRVTIAGKPKFTCVDGPEFDAHQTDWDELVMRNKAYLKQEKHICQLYKV